MSEKLMINNCQGSHIVVWLKNNDIISGDLAFYNYDDQVIHIKNYVLKRDNKTIEEGDFWIVNTRSWHNLSIEKVKEK